MEKGPEAEGVREAEEESEAEEEAEAPPPPASNNINLEAPKKPRISITISLAQNRGRRPMHRSGTIVLMSHPQHLEINEDQGGLMVRWCQQLNVQEAMQRDWEVGNGAEMWHSRAVKA